jgi:hypothetical protein
VTQTPPGGIVPATPGGGAPNQAINLINQLLTTPRQPPPGLGATTAQPTAGPAGIAGIASSYTGPSIMSYGNRTEFEEWEFVFQPNAQGTSGVGPQQQNPNGNPPNGQPGQPTPGGTPFPGFPPAGFPPPGLPQGFPPTGAPGLPAGRP